MTVRPATRRATAALFTAAAVLATAACGGSDDDSASPGPTAAPTVTAVPVSTEGLPPVERGAFPVRIKHTWNQAGTVIETEPKRVVVLGMREQDSMISLGLKPLTLRNYFGAAHPWLNFPWVPESAKQGDYTVLYPPTRDSKTGKLSTVDDGPVLANGFAQASNTPVRKEVFDYERIKSMNPDLIVAMFAGIVLEDYRALSEIAPTITMVSSDSKDYFSSWQEEVLVLGKIVGRPTYAQQQVATMRQLFVDTETKHPELRNASVAVAAPGPDGQIRIMNPYAPMSRFFTSLGMEFPGRIEAATRYTGVSRKMYGIESTVGNLSFLDNVDVLVWIVGHDGGEAMDKIKRTSAYQNMKVVRNKKVLELGPDEAEALYYSSLTSLPWAIDRLVPRIVGILGDKAARDRVAEEQAERAADAAGDLNINYDPTASPTSNPYQDMLNGTDATPGADPGADPGTEGTEGTEGPDGTEEQPETLETPAP
ncbi:ABC transporter substrate-binding protein [Sporichthya polymorpha]|uniref:ABC transporter substrate-binding protein n=1 Tax=Sporichthya polymorpha TaxID=35751 RepID=UPI0003727FBF|nr:ABC transporter substrate-binding protein [Sporichthya polymorpha]